MEPRDSCVNSTTQGTAGSLVCPLRALRISVFTLWPGSSAHVTDSCRTWCVHCEIREKGLEGNYTNWIKAKRVSGMGLVCFVLFCFSLMSHSLGWNFQIFPTVKFTCMCGLGWGRFQCWQAALLLPRYLASIPSHTLKHDHVRKFFSTSSPTQQLQSPSKFWNG